MALQMILGGSGTGKSFKVYQHMIDSSIANPNKNYVIIVPEQFTMQTQKKIVELHPHGGTMNIDIVSFTRLAYKVFEELEQQNGIALEDTGKSMIVRKVIGQKRNELEILNTNINKAGFVDEVKSLLSELYQYNIDEEKLEKAIELTTKKPLLNKKLKDMSTIYDAFKSFIKDRFITEEEILNILSSLINKSQLIKDSVICLDGFTGFTPSQYKLLKELMQYADIYVIFTIDARETPRKLGNEYELFNSIKKEVNKLLQIANETGTKVMNDIILKEQQRFKNSKDLKRLERNLFRFSKDNIDKENLTEDISIHIVKNPIQEIEYVAQKISYLVREKGYRYKEIAVVTGDMQLYDELTDRVFSEYNIPYFSDNKKSIMSNPFIEIIRASIEVVEKNFSYESVLRYLRTDFTGIPRVQVDIFENYILALGIRGYSWYTRQWDRVYKGFNTDNLVLINEVRQTVVRQIEVIRDSFLNNAHSVRENTEVLWNYVLYINAQSRLSEYQKYFESTGQLALAKQYEQIYRYTAELFDKLAELLGDEKLSIREYSEILEAGFEEIKIGLIPPGIDQVLLGDIQRSRLSDISVLFFVGVNDGIIPKNNTGGGIISDLEKQLLLENGIELSPTLRQRTFSEKFYLYLNITKPKDKIFISYSQISSDGKSLKPSYFINNIKQLFPNLEVTIQESESRLELLNTENAVMQYLIEKLRVYKKTALLSEEDKSLIRLLYEYKKDNLNFDKIIEAVFYSNREKGLEKTVAEALYGNELTNSVTRIEQYANCAYAHFLKYGLQLQERQKYSFRAMDLGNIFHSVMEKFSKELLVSNQSWNTVSDEQRQGLTRKCVEQAVAEYNTDILKDNARNEYMIERINKISQRTTWALQNQIIRGEFKPSEYEVVIQTSSVDAGDNRRVNLKGRIDRIDTYERNDDIYLKIIDYKSGSTEFDITDVYYGLQLQLVVYMNAAIDLKKSQNKTKSIIPAGLFYYNISDPIVDEKSGETKSELDERLLSKLKLNGLVNNNEDIIKLMDKSYNGKSSILPVSKTRGGDSRTMVSNENFDKLFNFVDEKILCLSNEIFNGKIDINPYKFKTETSCEYCNYKPVCRFDKDLDYSGYRKQENLTNDEIWNRIGGKEDGVDTGTAEGYTE